MSAPQCDHRGPSTVAMGGRRLGRRCTKKSKYHAANKSSEGAGNFCERHGLQRVSGGVKLTLLQRLGRCQCTGGDVPHRGAEEHLTGKPAKPSGATIVRGQRHHWRCTRSASVQLQRVISTEGKVIASTERVPRSYCDLCALAIQRYQGGEVERV